MTFKCKAPLKDSFGAGGILNEARGVSWKLINLSSTTHNY